MKFLYEPAHCKPHREPQWKPLSAHHPIPNDPGLPFLERERVDANLFNFALRQVHALSLQQIGGLQ